MKFPSFSCCYSRKLMSFLSLTLVLSLALAGALFAPLGHAEDALPRLPVATERLVESAGYTQKSVFTGTVEAGRSSALGFDANGRVLQVLVEEGDQVEAGQVLARLDTARLQASRAELTAAQQQAEVNLRLATVTFNRLQEALGYKGVSQQQADEASDAKAVAEAAVALANARLGSLAVELDKTRLKAPYAGMIARRFVDEGLVIGAGAPVLELHETGHLEIRIGIAGDAINRIVPGERYSVLDRMGRSHPVMAKATLPVRTSTGRTVDAIFQADGSSGLRPGDLTRLSLEIPQEATGFWIPISALEEGERGLWAAVVAAPTGQSGHLAQRRQVQILHQEADRVFVQGALSEGELLISDGLHRIVAGQQVAPRTAALVDSTNHDGAAP